MTQARVLEILRAYGANPARWPEAEREDVQACLDLHPELLAEIDVETELDALLTMPDPEPSELLQHRILRAVPEPVSQWGWRAPVAAGIALVLGVTIGFAGGYVAPAEQDVETIYADAYDSLGEDWVDWLGEDT